MAGVGQSTATQMGQNTLATGRSLGQNILGSGSARASGYQQAGAAKAAQYNQMGQLMTGAGQGVLDLYYMNKFMPQPTANTGPAYQYLPKKGLDY